MTDPRREPEPVSSDEGGVGDPPPGAATVFGDRLDLAVRLAGVLAGDAVEQGLIGPREVPRLWERHLLNCAVVAELVPTGARVVDVGSGAGLPGLVLAVARPDLRVDLVEPMLRRTRFLDEAVRDLGLGDTVRVIRGRAEERAVRAEAGGADRVVARAVAPLARLLDWCLPLTAPAGRVLALKGRSAQDEITQYLQTARHPVAVELAVVGAAVVSEPVRVVVATPREQRRTRGARR